ncbi:MAG: PEP-CTERM sorting domain-containing protein [Akkermansiaceae bacterium]
MKTTESIKKTVKTFKLVMTAIIAMNCLSGNAFAAIVSLKDIVQATSYTSIGGAPQNGSIDNTIDGTGLSSTLNTGDAVPGVLPTHESMYPGAGTTGVRWFIEPQNNPITDITFNLGGAYDLGAVIFWNYNETQDAFPDGQTQRGISSVTASFSSDGLSFTGDTTLNFAEAGGLPVTGETVSMLADDVQYVKLTDFVSHGDTVLAGFNEIRFATVPEPSSTALLGLSGIALMLRRKRS